MSEQTGEPPRFDVERKDNHMTQIARDPDPLEKYEYELGDDFVRWDAWGNSPEDGEKWRVVNIRWSFKEAKLWERDGVPEIKDHRKYVILNHETWEETQISEADIETGDWRPVAEVEEIEE